MKVLSKLLRWLVVGIIRGYQRYVSVWLPGQCRFHPTCSEYTLESIRVHGLTKGSWLGLKRVLHCHPYSGTGGIDPVPPRDKRND